MSTTAAGGAHVGSWAGVADPVNGRRIPPAGAGQGGPGVSLAEAGAVASDTVAAEDGRVMSWDVGVDSTPGGAPQPS